MINDSLNDIFVSDNNKKLFIRIYYGTKKIALLTALVLLTTSQVIAHGYVESPVSRAYLCNTEKNISCGNIQYEPQSIEAPEGLFERGGLDNKMGSAGVSMAAALNEQE